MNWIKIRTDLLDDSDVLRLSDILGTDDPTTVGLLVRFWAWIDRQTADGTGIAVSRTRLDKLVGRDGFTGGMLEIGWLAGDEGGFYIPNFERHNGNSAKARSLETEAKRLRRSDKSERKASDKTSDKRPTEEGGKVRLEKRREEYSTLSTEAPAADRADDWPTVETVKAHARSQMTTGITEECAEAFWNKHEALGWRYNGQPIRDWRPLLANFARNWNDREKGKSTQTRPAHRRGEFPEPALALPDLPDLP